MVAGRGGKMPEDEAIIFRGLRRLKSRAELRRHIHLDNNILFPRTGRMVGLTEP